MICPRCGADYREGFSRCSDCDVDLVAVPDSTNASTEPLALVSTDARLVVLSQLPQRVRSPGRAGGAAERRARCDAPRRPRGALNAGLTYTRGVQLLVLEEDAAAARQALATEA